MTVTNAVRGLRIDDPVWVVVHKTNALVRAELIMIARHGVTLRVLPGAGYEQVDCVLPLEDHAMGGDQQFPCRFRIETDGLTCTAFGSVEAAGHFVAERGGEGHGCDD